MTHDSREMVCLPLSLSILLYGYSRMFTDGWLIILKCPDL